MTTTDLTPASRRVLSSLAHFASATPAKIALHLRMGEQGVHGCLRFLRKRGLAMSHAGGVFAITPAGIAMVAS